MLLVVGAKLAHILLAKEAVAVVGDLQRKSPGSDARLS